MYRVQGVAMVENEFADPPEANNVGNRRYGETSEEEERDTSQELNLSLVPSDQDGARALSPAPSDRTLSWDGDGEPEEDQLPLRSFPDCEHNCSTRTSQWRPPPGLIRFDDVFWGEDEDLVLRSRKVPSPSPRKRKRNKARAKYKR